MYSYINITCENIKQFNILIVYGAKNLTHGIRNFCQNSIISITRRFTEITRSITDFVETKKTSDIDIVNSIKLRLKNV